MNQGELPFDAPTAPIGYDRWREERRAAKRELARKLGLPLGHQAEVWLQGEVRLRGRLELAEELLIVPEGRDAQLRLAVGQTIFAVSEIESCVRTD